jgi:hypothetical protein
MGLLDDVEGLLNDTVTGVTGVIGGALSGLSAALKTGATTGGVDAVKKTFTAAWAAQNSVAAAALIQQGWTQVG